jgi:hypothetical protein
MHNGQIGGFEAVRKSADMLTLMLFIVTEAVPPTAKLFFWLPWATGWRPILWVP